MTIDHLRRIVEETDTRVGWWFDVVVQGLIVLSLVSFSIDTLPDLSETTRRVLWLTEAGTVMLFTVEYLLRVLVAKWKLRFVFSFFGLIDLMAILPFYLALGIDLRSVRIFRLLRMFRALKLMRYSRAIDHFRRAFLLIREELVLFFSAALVLVYFSAAGIYFFERDAQPKAFASIFHSLWWAVSTLTTVGYGDVYPVTVGGRIFTFVILMIGLGIVAVPSGLMASALSEARKQDLAECAPQAEIGNAQDTGSPS